MMIGKPKSPSVVRAFSVCDTDQQFMADLQREDDVGLVLRGHLHVEHQLIEIASVLLPFAARCDWGKISYRAKVEFAYGCGLPEDLKDLLERLGAIRNGFAHTLNVSLPKQSVLDLYNSLSVRLRDGLKISYRAMGLGELAGPSSLEPRDLLTLIFLIARQATKAEIHTLRDGDSIDYYS
jgi:hypothetical protein